MAGQTGRYSADTRYVDVFFKRQMGPVTSNDYVWPLFDQ